MIRIIQVPQYDLELKKILHERTVYFATQGFSAREQNKKFLSDVKATLSSLRLYPFQGVDFPSPVKKILTSQGNSQCAILYSIIPHDHEQKVEKVEEIQLNSIMLTSSEVYNSYVSSLKQCDF